jgi:hypothetical protein
MNAVNFLVKIKCEKFELVSLEKTNPSRNKDKELSVISIKVVN